jgi:hypothetical protein
VIVGIRGEAQHGKDSVAQRLVARWGFERRGFADELKAMALDLNPYIAFDVDPDGFPTNQDKLLRLKTVVDAYGWEKAKVRIEVRRTLQVLGTECLRYRDPDFWVRQLDKHYSDALYHGTPKFAVADVRFENEARWVKSMGGFVVQVIRPDFDNGLTGVTVTHESETQDLDEFTDVIIYNEGTLADLALMVDQMARDRGFDDPGTPEPNDLHDTTHVLHGHPGEVVAQHVLHESDF